jgi:hypothetical protein
VLSKKNDFKKERKNNMKKVLSIVLVVLMVLGLSACSQAARVSHNISKEADNFNVTRRLAVINARTDKPIFEIIGNFSISNTSTNELAVTVEVENGKYKKHYVYLNDWTIYTVEDVSGAYVNKYHYEVNYLPEMIIPVTITSKD